MTSRWIDRLKRVFGPRGGRGKPPRPHSCRPAVEGLEERLVPASGLNPPLGGAGVSGAVRQPAPAIDLTISTAATANVQHDAAGDFTATGTGANINVADIRADLLAGKSVTITDNPTGAQAGNITWQAGADLDYNGVGVNNLSLTVSVGASAAGGSLTLDSRIFDSDSQTPDALNVNLSATRDLTVASAINAAAGAITLAADVQPDGTGDDGVGALTVGPGASVIGNAVTLRGADVHIDTSANPATVTATAYATSFLTQLDNPSAVVRDSQGNLYVANSNFSTVSKLTPDGQISTYASGLHDPTGLALDTQGDLFVSNFSNGTVSEVTPDGRVSTFATGFTNPTGLAFYQGTLFVADAAANTVSKVSADGTSVATYTTGLSQPYGITFGANGTLFVANRGNGTVTEAKIGGKATATLASGFVNPEGVAIDLSGNLLVANTGQSDVLKVTLDGQTVTTFATNFGSSFAGPAGLAVDPATGNVFVAYSGANTVFQVSPDGQKITPLGAGLSAPYGEALDAQGNLYVANFSNGTVGKVTPQGQYAAFATGFTHPTGLAFDSQGNLYVADAAANTVSRVTPAGQVSVFASGFNGPTGLAFDAHGDLFVASTSGGTVSEVTPGGQVSVLPTTFNMPFGLAFDARGDLFVSDNGAGTVVELTPSAAAPGGFSASTFASVKQPAGLAFDARGNLLVASIAGVGNGVVSKITPDGQVSTYALGLSVAVGLAFDANGNLFVTTPLTNTINRLVPGSLTIRSSLPSLPISLGGADNAVAGVNLTDAELARFTATDLLTVGDNSQTGDITFTTVTLTAASVQVLESTVGTLSPAGSPSGTGAIVLDEDNSGPALSDGNAVVSLTSGSGNIQVINPPTNFAPHPLVGGTGPVSGNIPGTNPPASAAVVAGTLLLTSGGSVGSAASPLVVQAAVLGPSTVFGNLYLSDTISLTTAGPITAGGLISLTLAGDFTAHAGDFPGTATDLVFTGGLLPQVGTGSVPQHFDSGGQAFRNVTHQGVGTLQLVNHPLTLSGNLTNAAGAGNFDANNLAVTVGGLTTVGGSLSAPGSGTSANILPGDYLAGAGAQVFAGGLVIDGLFTGGSGPVTAGGVTIAAGATLVAPTTTLTDTGDWADAGSFNANGGTVIFAGTNQHVTGSTTFFNLSKVVSFADTFTFQAGSTQTVAGTLTLQGAAGGLLALRSSVPGTRWNLNPQASRFVTFVDVQDGANLSGTPIAPGASRDSGNNVNWFPPAPLTPPAGTGGGGNLFTGTVTLTGPANNRATVGVFDPFTATWYLRNSNSPGAPDIKPFQYGGAFWVGVVGDWDGNGTTTIGVVDLSTETWYLRNSNTPGAPDLTPFRFGAPGWVPVVGDWGGTGHTGIGVYDPFTGTFYLRNEDGPGFADAGIIHYGAAGWAPVVGDWDGNGTTTIGVFNPFTATWYLKNSNTPGAPDITPFQYGLPGWKPVVGDWNGDGTTSIGVVNPAGTWFLRNENSPGAPDIMPFAYGAGSWEDLAGAWAGPGRPLRLAGGAPGGLNVTPLTAPQLSGIASAALARLQADGLSAALVSRLAATQLVIGQLGGGTLALETPGRVVFDATADGYGWFVDPTPAQDEEFLGGAGVGDAAGHVDLLTAVLQELGQEAGLTADALTAPLGLGARHTQALDAVFAAAGH